MEFGVGDGVKLHSQDAIADRGAVGRVEEAKVLTDVCV
jgi:hypothetical protein